MILNIYKEKDWTSFDVVAKVRGILNASLSDRVPNKIKRKRKVGHAGTLDPLAEGVLVILTDSDTKIQDKIMKSEKEYECEISFGATSETYDLEGKLTRHEIPQDLDIETELDKHLKKYVGEFEQKVPPYSAVKVKGKELYKKARAGKIDESEIPTKKVHIYAIKKLGFYERAELPTVKLKITCGKGTYVRSLAHDLGEDLGIGGVLVSLVRTRVGDYVVEEALRIEDFEEKFKNVKPLVRQEPFQ